MEWFRECMDHPDFLPHRGFRQFLLIRHLEVFFCNQEEGGARLRLCFDLIEALLYRWIGASGQLVTDLVTLLSGFTECNRRIRSMRDQLFFAIKLILLPPEL
jgi:hypothetical protein